MSNKLYEEIDRLRAENKELKKDLALNASMLAKQCDMARVVETEAMRLKNIVANYLSGNICKKSFKENIKKLTAKADEK